MNDKIRARKEISVCITPEENTALEAGALKYNISSLKQLIDELTVQEYPPSDTANYNALMEIRQNLINMKDQPGSADDLEALYNIYFEQVASFANYTFRFE